jgi:hypothetical protein
MTKNDERRLSTFGRKILVEYLVRYAGEGNGGSCTIKLEEVYNEPNIVNVIKSNCLRWAGHVMRMDENELPKKIL